MLLSYFVLLFLEAAHHKYSVYSVVAHLFLLEGSVDMRFEQQVKLLLAPSLSVCDYLPPQVMQVLCDVKAWIGKNCVMAEPGLSQSLEQS